MRIVHSRKRVFGNTDHAFEHKFTLLVWILSILKWKQYGNEVVLYTDNITLEKIKEYEFDGLYDEINTTLLDSNSDVCKGIDFYCFWAMPKLLSYQYEEFTLGNDVVAADTDVVPMSDISRFWKNCNVAVWSNKEYIEFKSLYPSLEKLPRPDGYEFPEWFTGKAKPLNTGIIHINDKNILKIYLDEVVKIATDNHEGKNCPNWITMCNAEQRTLGELVKHYDLSYQVVQPINEGIFNRNAFHTHGYKQYLSNEDSLLFNCNFLLMIKELNETMYKKLIKKDWFKEEKEYINNNNNKIEIPENLKRYYN